MGSPAIFTYQTPLTLNDTLVQNEWQWVMGTGSTGGTVATYESGVAIYKIGVGVETADETLEVKIVADGVTIPATGLALTAATDYACYLTVNAAALTEAVIITAKDALSQDNQGIMVESRNVAVAYRKTTALGANAGVIVVSWGKK